jgi:uncharacterized repeat protein (TIGR03803 family)
MTVRSRARNSATCREWVRLTLSPAKWLILTLAMLQVGHAQTKLTVLHRFSGGPDGGEPFAPLVRDSAGNLYGTTVLGGKYASGVIFRISPTDTFTPLYSFTGGNDGAFLYAGLVRDSLGNLYGAASSGGKGGYGTVFELSPSRKLRVLHSFTDSDGGPPNGVIRDSAGNLYGTASGGISGYGTVFKISSTGVFNVSYRFTGGADGAYPFAPLVLDSKGNLYGTTLAGGSTGGNCGSVGCGVVFKLDHAGTEMVLYSFLGGSDGGNPDTALVLDSTGNLFGITPSGGSFSGVCGANGNRGCGVVFEVDTSNTETALHTFTGQPDGEYPQGGLLLEEAAHTLFGTTNNGGANDFGTVFKVDMSSNTETVLHNFTGSGGEYPDAGVIRDKAGNLFSTSSAGGASGPTKCCRGIVYRLGK